MEKPEVQKLIRDEVTESFNKRVGDTPNDALQLVSRKYVNLNGVLASRPTSSVASTGQQYFATDLGKPVFFNGTKWVDSTSSVIAG